MRVPCALQSCLRARARQARREGKVLGAPGAGPSRLGLSEGQLGACPQTQLAVRGSGVGNAAGLGGGQAGEQRLWREAPLDRADVSGQHGRQALPGEGVRPCFKEQGWLIWA